MPCRCSAACMCYTLALLGHERAYILLIWRRILRSAVSTHGICFAALDRRMYALQFHLALNAAHALLARHSPHSAAHRRIMPHITALCRASPHYAAHHRTTPRITASCRSPHHAAHYRIMPLTTSPYHSPPHHSAPSSSGCMLCPSSAASAPSRISSMRATSELGLFMGSSCSMGRKCMCL